MSQSTKLEAIRDEAAERLKSLITEALPDIENAIQDAVSEAQTQAAEAKFRLGFTIEYNLDRDTMTYRLSFGVRRKWESVNATPDPAQTEMQLAN